MFGIDNAFTTTDKIYYKVFVADVRGRLKTGSEDWDALAGTIQKDIERCLDEFGQAGPINLVNLIQIVVFRAVILKFFPEHAVPSDSHILSLTEKINSLWISSKHQAYLHSDSLDADKFNLFSDLRHIFDAGGRDQEGRENPLNILLPAYETLWRIVLRLFLEVRFRSTEVEYLRYTYLFKAFITQPDGLFNFYPPLHPYADSEDPVELAYSAQHLGRVSMKDIVNEGLRLYPPTRRIYRQIDDEKVAVDVEAIHRDTISWGDDALTFRPSRFLGIKPRASCFLPFGSGVFECPARKSFAPVMIGVMIAALTMKIGKDYQLGGNGVDEVANVRNPLGNGRNALEDLWIESIKTE